jgi:hypothetical protein
MQSDCVESHGKAFAQCVRKHAPIVSTGCSSLLSPPETHRHSSRRCGPFT